MSAMTQVEIGEHVRTITDAEAVHYREHGWAYLPSLISADLASEVLSHAKQITGCDADVVPSDPTERAAFMEEFGALRYHLTDVDPWFGDFFRSRALGEAAAQLCGIRPLRLFSGTLLTKLPEPPDMKAKAFSEHLTRSNTPWHQDFGGMPLDRRGAIAFWFALVEVTPEMGAMQYMSRSHNEGPLGGTQVVGQDPFEIYPDLDGKYEVSPLRTMQPGDVLAHDSLTLHRAEPNHTDRIRWVVTSTRMPASTYFNGMPNGNTDRQGLKAWDSFDHPAYPIVAE